MKFLGTNFAELFQWLSNSFNKISNSKDGEKLDITPQNPNYFQLTI
jgi:uncharacterized protein YegL